MLDYELKVILEGGWYEADDNGSAKWKTVERVMLTRSLFL